MVSFINHLDLLFDMARDEYSDGYGIRWETAVSVESDENGQPLCGKWGITPDNNAIFRSFDGGWYRTVHYEKYVVRTGAPEIADGHSLEQLAGGNRETGIVLFDAGKSLEELLMSGLGLRDKKALMKTNLDSGNGLSAIKLINDYLIDTSQRFRLLIKGDDVVLYEKCSDENIGEKREIVRIYSGRKKEAGRCKKPFVIAKPRVTYRKHQDGVERRYFHPGSQPNAVHYKIRDLWSLLGRYAVDLDKRVRPSSG